MHFVKTSAGELRITQYAPATHMPLHSHDFDKVSVVLAGSVAERSAVGERVVESGWIVAKPAGVLHEDVVGRRGLCMLSLRATPQTALGREAWRSLTGDYRWMALDPCVGHMVRLMTEGVAEPEAAIEEVLFSLVGHVARTERSSCDWVRRAFRILEDRHDAPPTLVELAEEVAVHPVTLSRAFTNAGTSKTEIVHRRRVQKALVALQKPSPLAVIAAELGYADGGHFTRSFRHWMGCTPTRFRTRFLNNR